MLKKATSGVLAIVYVLTYWKYAPRAKMAAALLDDFFEHARRVLALDFSHANTGLFPEIF